LRAASQKFQTCGNNNKKRNLKHCFSKTIISDKLFGSKHTDQFGRHIEYDKKDLINKKIFFLVKKFLKNIEMTINRENKINKKAKKPNCDLNDFPTIRSTIKTAVHMVAQK